MENEGVAVVRILLRAHKDPFSAADPRHAYRRNLIGDNVGNLLISTAAHKLLCTRGTTVETAAAPGADFDADRINERVDHVVIPLANAFRLSYAHELDAMSATIERLTVPVTVLGVGAQLGLDGDTARLDAIRPAVQRFVRAVLDRSPTIGVRGEYTERYLRGLGFRDVDVIGCPSLFLQGSQPRVVKRTAVLDRQSRIGLNLSPYVPGLAPLVNRQATLYPRLEYIAQHRDALGMLLDPAHRPRRLGTTDQSVLPTHRAHPLVAQGRTRMFVDPKPWIDHLRDFDFSFGTRIHGNIAALLAGTPAIVLAHDSRTLELARFSSIPHTTMARLSSRTDAASLYDQADFAAYNAGLRSRFRMLGDYFALHGLRHVYQEGEEPRRFDRRMDETAFPGAVGGVPIPSTSSAQALLARVSLQARRVRRVRAVPVAA